MLTELLCMDLIKAYESFHIATALAPSVRIKPVSHHVCVKS